MICVFERVLQKGLANPWTMRRYSSEQACSSLCDHDSLADETIPKGRTRQSQWRDVTELKGRTLYLRKALYFALNSRELILEPVRLLIRTRDDREKERFKSSFPRCVLAYWCT